TTTVYDHAGRPTDSYGPAPDSCFNGQVPNGSCTNPAVPKSTTAYDEGTAGLATAWWDNKDQAGSPKLHTTGIGYPGGYQFNDWAGGAPAGMPADNFSFRSTGEILLAQAGTYKFRFYSDDGVRLFVDDRLVDNSWDAAAGYTPLKNFVNPTVGTRHRIRIDYREKTGGAVHMFLMTPPGGAEQLVPASILFPRYGLVTSTTDADGKKTSTEYGRPELSLATATVADPAGLALRTSTSYEPPLAGNRWLRRLSRTLPAGREPYAGAVFADGAHAHWRLGETGGSLATDATGKGRTATYTAGVIPGQPGGMVGDTDKAVGFNGSGTVTLPDRGLVMALTVEAWFKTAAPGVVIGM
ncbi:MAG: PA14 domain-containing protein, partial [Actinomycetota bacterium]